MPMPSSEPKKSGGVEGDGNALHNEGTEQHDQCDGADKAQFLAHDGEDKVVLGVGQPLVLLHAVADAHAEQTAGGDGVDALAGLPQHTGGIGGGQAPDAAQTLRRITVAGGQRLIKYTKTAAPAGTTTAHSFTPPAPAHTSMVAKIMAISSMAELWGSSRSKTRMGISRQAGLKTHWNRLLISRW